MTQDEYEATISAERTFGRIQVHQQFRALARELGLPADCSLPAEVNRRLPRWYVDPEAVRKERWEADKREMRIHYLYGELAVVERPLSDLRYLTVA
jgi:hypothetical protein